MDRHPPLDTDADTLPRAARPQEAARSRDDRRQADRILAHSLSVRANELARDGRAADASILERASALLWGA